MDNNTYWRQWDKMIISIGQDNREIMQDGVLYSACILNLMSKLSTISCKGISNTEGLSLLIEALDLLTDKEREYIKNTDIAKRLMSAI